VRDIQFSPQHLDLNSDLVWSKKVGHIVR
jgi:hypothetical protein